MTWCLIHVVSNNLHFGLHSKSTNWLMLFSLSKEIIYEIYSAKTAVLEKFRFFGQIVTFASPTKPIVDKGVDKTWAMAHGPPYGLPIFLIINKQQVVKIVE